LDGAATLIDPTDSAAFSAAGAAVSHVVDSIAFQEDEILIDTITIRILNTILDGTYDKTQDIAFTTMCRDLLSITWAVADDAVTAVPAVSDFSGKQAMTLQIVADSASGLNLAARNGLSFTIVLRDALGREAKVVTAPGQNALSTYPGQVHHTELSPDFVISYFAPTTPLGMLSIPLSYFGGVDLTQITEMELLFDQTPSGALYIAAWQLQ